MQLGAKHVEYPFLEFGQISTVLYFLYFTVVMYGVTRPFFCLNLIHSIKTKKKNANTFVDLTHKKDT